QPVGNIGIKILNGVHLLEIFRLYLKSKILLNGNNQINIIQAVQIKGFFQVSFGFYGLFFHLKIFRNKGINTRNYFLIIHNLVSLISRGFVYKTKKNGHKTGYLTSRPKSKIM